MYFKILCLLILLNLLQTKALGRIPIHSFTDPTVKKEKSSTERLDLPRGFNPQLSPMNPLLYPFVTEQPGWRPIVTDKVILQSTTSKTLLEDRISSSTSSQQEFDLVEGPVLETIVYGTWKPEPPIQPKTEKNEGILGSKENVMQGKLGGFIEDLSNKKSISDYSDISSSNESYENSNTSKRKFHKKTGRRKILKNNIRKQDDSLATKLNESMEIIKVNSTDPALINMIKQINESVETTTKTKRISLQNSNNSKQISKEWPVDFINSPESDQTQENSAQDNFYSYIGDSSEPPQASAVSHTPTTSINITKMGVPYENQNYGEDPSICVPLSVREPSASNPNEIIEVERVYCFPLPVSETKPSVDSLNDTFVLDKNVKINVLDYEELSSSNSMHLRKLYWIFNLSFLTTFYLT